MDPSTVVASDLELPSKRGEYWRAFMEYCASQDPSESMKKAIASTHKRDAALVLGGGALAEVTALLDAGFQKILWVDDDPHTGILARECDSPCLVFEPWSIDQYFFGTNTFSLVLAPHGLPFVRPLYLSRVFENVHTCLHSESIFAGRGLTVVDTWIYRRECSVLTHIEGGIQRALESKGFDVPHIQCSNWNAEIEGTFHLFDVIDFYAVKVPLAELHAS